MATIIFDIDGVLNPFDARFKYVPGYFEHSNGQNNVFLNPDLMNPFLDDLEAAGHNIIWGSAWEDRSNQILEMLGRTSSWDYIPLDTEDVGLGTWKIKSVRRWVDANLPDNEPIIWIDDELEADAWAWGAERGNMLCISPKQYEGLDENLVNQMRAFLKNFS